MNIEEIELPAQDGYPLGCTLYLSDAVQAAERCVIIGGATAVRQRYYHKYAAYLCDQGFTTVTFDYRGIGRSLHGHIKDMHADMRAWGEQDLSGVIEATRARFAPTKLFVVGHSAGGQLVGLCDTHTVTGLLAVAAQSGYWGHWPKPDCYALAALWYVLMPGLTRCLDYFPAKALRLGENLPGGVAEEWSRWCRSPYYISDRDGRPIRDKFQQFDRPILAYSFSDDRMAPQAAVHSLMACFEQARIEFRHITPKDLGVRSIKHFGFFTDRFAETLWKESVQWLRQH